MTWLADAYLDAGELERSVSITSNAVALVSSVASVRPKARAGQVARRLTALGLPEGAQLAERVEAIKPLIPDRL